MNETNTTAELPLLLTPADACRELSIGLSKLNQLVAADRIHVVRLGGMRRIRRDELVRFIDQLEAAEIDA